MHGLYSGPQAGLNPSKGIQGGVADRIKNLGDGDRSCLRRHSGRRILTGDMERAVAGVRVSAILHPTVVLAFLDSTSLVEHRDGPPAQRPDRGSPFLRHQHRDLSAGTDPPGSHLFRAVSTGQGFRIAGSGAFPRVPPSCAQTRRPARGPPSSPVSGMGASCWPMGM